MNLTALTGGAVYANGLQLVREANGVIMGFAGYDAMVVGEAITDALMAPPPLDIATVALAAEEADPDTRKPAQDMCASIFGVGTPKGAGLYPALIEGQALATAGENSLSALPPFYAYNYETATDIEVAVPNMALRFRYADEFLPDNNQAPYSLVHDGVRHYFYSDQVEPAKNPLHPKQMRVKKSLDSEFAGWWVRREKGAEEGKEGNGLSSHNPFSAISKISLLKDYLHQFKLDITDRDDPACHTFSLLGNMKIKSGRGDKAIYEIGEARVESDGIAAWDAGKPFQVYLTRVSIDAFPVLRNAINKLQGIPFVNNILQSSDILNGI
ncbi:MAG TPA: hypothetical protein VJ873_00675 [bacterium]|nr:hypothetical protein [bacterium]